MFFVSPILSFVFARNSSERMKCRALGAVKRLVEHGIDEKKHSQLYRFIGESRIITAGAA
jgi:hypothetical protein